MNNSHGPLWYCSRMFALIFLVAVISGCDRKVVMPAAELRQELKGSFLMWHPRVFLYSELTHGRGIAPLVTSLGYQGFWDTSRHNAAGTKIYATTHGGCQVLVLSSDGPPRLLNTPRNPIFDESGAILGWKSEREVEGEEDIHISGVGVLPTARPVIDHSGRYLAAIDASEPPVPNAPERSTTIRIYSLKDLKPLVSSKLTGRPQAIFVMQNKLYLVVGEAESFRVVGVTIETYDISSGKLVLEKTSVIPGRPWRTWSSLTPLNLHLHDVDATTGDIWFSAWHEFPTLGARACMYNVITGKLRWLGLLGNHGVEFLSPDIFDGTLKALEAKEAEQAKKAKEDKQPASAE